MLLITTKNVKRAIFFEQNFQKLLKIYIYVWLSDKVIRWDGWGCHWLFSVMKQNYYCLGRDKSGQSSLSLTNEDEFFPRCCWQTV